MGVTSTARECAFNAGLSTSARLAAFRIKVYMKLSQIDVRPWLELHTSGFLWYMLPRVPVCSKSWSRAPRSIRSESVVIGGFSERTISPATVGLIASILQYMKPRSRKSGLSTSSVAHFRTL